MNRSKAKGTLAETACVNWFRAHGFPWAERLTLSGAYDRGDISLLPGHAVIVEVKSYSAAGNGQPATKMLAGWMAEVEREVNNAGADHGVLVVKRAGSTDVGRWFAYVHPAAFLAMVGAQVEPDMPDPICTTVACVTAVLRTAGYGDPIPLAAS
ncbi:hypothetical protein [Luteipulveratus mongoliensis]|uniref:Holliday junction resolvase n=1 Tax=Luteipulveratus mongoliensis TaxID=571913 RepID=A0A0K1JGE2_9MICO|nr:hypothetical protein [Luteipulveratus mongoliensis]AKU15766.1 hypothetical protein VV02_07710 [Luteipulveratus mongoliensis]